MKKLRIILPIILCIIIFIILSISFILNRNNNYLEKMTKKIQDNYEIKEEITDINQYGNYYIITTTKNVIVLNKEYQEIRKEDINILAEKDDNMELIYKTNKLMYEEKQVEDKVLIYKYYDATTGNFIKETTMEQK